jgi:hypothetical protein
MLRSKKLLVIAASVGVASLAVASSAFAIAPGTKVTASLKAGTTMTFSGDIDSLPITVTCKKFSASGIIPSGKVYSMDLSAPPAVTGCTDSIGGTDTFKTNQTNGKWIISVTKTSPYKLTLTIPTKGATFTSTKEKGCVITGAPTKADGVVGTYNGVNTDTVKNASITTKGTGCTSTNAKTSATIVLSPSPGKPPF